MGKLLSVLLSGYTVGQKWNYVKFVLANKKKTVLSYKPLTISVVATDRCTLSCDMCPTHSRIVPRNYKWRQDAGSDMDIDMFRRAVDKYPDALEVHIIGSGEPLLNKDFFKIVEYARSKKITVKTFSNGTTIGRYLPEIIASGLDSITISLNGHNREEYSRMTGMPPQTYDTIMKDTEALIREKRSKRPDLKVKVSFIIDKYNYRSIPEMVSAALKIDPDQVFLCSFLPAPFEGLSAKDRLITTNDTEAVRFIEDVKNKMDAKTKEKVSFPSVIDTTLPGNRCQAHFQQMRLDARGRISSCSMMLLNMDNAASIADPDPWNSDFFVRTREKCINDELVDDMCVYCVNCKGIDLK